MMTNPSDFSRRKWEEALDLKRRGAYPEAEKALKEAIEETPEHTFLKVSLADLYLRQDRLRESRILVDPILSLDPHHPQALSVLGGIFFKEHRLEEALRCFRQACLKDKSPYLLRRLAMTLREMRRYEEALEILDSAMADSGENLPLLKEKALTLNRMKRWDDALEVYEKAQKLDPEDGFVRREMYRLRGRGREDAEIIGELKTVLNLPSRKDDPQLHGLLGQKLKEAGRLEEAVVEFHKAWGLSSGNHFFLKQEGFCHHSLGKHQEAIHALSQVFRKEPEDYRIRTTLKRLYGITRDQKGFVTLLEEVLREHPENVKLLGVLRAARKEAEKGSHGDS